MKSLAEILEEIARWKPGTVLFDRKGASFTIEELVALSKRGKVIPKGALRKKQFYGGTTSEGRVSIVRQVPGTGPVPIFLEGETPARGAPKGGFVVDWTRR